MASLGRVITFYSYKGGVGRSMALANVAAICAQRGKRVLALDFDFEAPGLHRYFLSSREEGEPPRYAPVEPRPGVLNYLRFVYDELVRRYPDGTGFDAPEVQEQLPRMLGELLDEGDYLYEVQIADPNQKQLAPVPVYFIQAARFDQAYPELVRSLDWQRFYDLYGEVFPALARELSRRYDYVLIDSRTGVTDIGSICTMLLPEKLVLAFTPNEQSLRGALDAAWQAILGRRQMPERQPLQVYPLLSRVEDGEEKLKRMWISRAQRGFERLFSEANDLSSYDLETYFNAIRVPHRGYYAYGERIAAEEQRASETGSLSEVYHQFLDCLDQKSMEEAQEVIRKSGFDAQEAMVRSLAGQMRSGFFRDFDRLRPVAPMIRLMDADKEIRQGRTADAMRIYDDVINEATGSPDKSLQITLAAALAGKAKLLSVEGRHQDALLLCGTIIQMFSASNDPFLSIEVVRAHHNAGYLWMQLGNPAKAVASYDSAILSCSRQTSIEAREALAKALAAKAEAFQAQGKREEEIAILDQIERRFGKSTEIPLIRVSVAALVNKAAALARYGRLEEAEAVREDLIRRFRGSADIEVRRLVGVGLLARAGTITGQPAEEIAVLDDAVLRLEGSEEPSLIESLANALTLRALTLQTLERDDEALEQYAQVIARFGASEWPKIQTTAARAMYCMGLLLRSSKRMAEAHASMAEMHRRWEHAKEPAVRRIVKDAFSARIQWLREDGQLESLFAAYDQFLQTFERDEDVEIHHRICLILLEKSATLIEQHRYSEAEAAANEAYTLANASREPALLRLLPHIKCTTGVALFLHAKQVWQDGDEAAARSMIDLAANMLEEARSGEPEHPIILENVAYVAFLRGHEDEARLLLGKALALDPIKVREGALKDASVHPLPQDEAFRSMVLRLSDNT